MFALLLLAVTLGAGEVNDKIINKASRAAFGRQQGAFHPLIDQGESVVEGDSGAASATVPPSIGVPKGFCATGWTLQTRNSVPVWRCPEEGEPANTKIEMPVTKGSTNRLGIREELAWLTEMDRDVCGAENHLYDDHEDTYQVSLLHTIAPIHGYSWRLWDADCANIAEEDEQICIQGKDPARWAMQGELPRHAPADGRSCLRLWHQKMRARMMCERRMHFPGGVHEVLRVAASM
jgi:hypothetical protein